MKVVMNSWILQHFLNPAFFWPGMLLVSAPIIIHLINRMRYRRVRFAAMEFLLASQKRNQRRVLIEQLLLLLLRVLMVMIVVALIARLILDPSQISLFQGAKSHHLVILDDTASMRNRAGDGLVFDRAREVIRRMLAEGAETPRSQVFTLIRMSAPEESLAGLSEVEVTSDLLVEMTERLDALRPTHQAADPARALEVALERMQADRSTVRHVHVLSDFRQTDWIDNKSAVAALQALSEQEIRLNLVKCVQEVDENLGIVDLGGDVKVAAAGVPVTLQATVRNWGTREAEDVRGELYIDGRRLPRTVDFQNIPPGSEGTRTFDVVFPTAEPHSVRFTIRDDAFDVDNERFLAVDVPESHPVLIIDGSPGTEQAFYIADALAADQSVTGFQVTVMTPEEMRRTSLAGYDLIYLINVPELAADAQAALEAYVQSGGGLAWYMGDAIRPAFYNDKLFNEEAGLFPVRIGVAPVVTERTEGATTVQPDLVAGRHPLLKLFADAETLISDLIFINLSFPLAAEQDDYPVRVKDAEVLATLRGRSPLIFEHRYGAGRVVTVLTAAGPLMNPQGLLWSNWANGPVSYSFAIFQLDLAKHLVRTDRMLPALKTGTPIELRLNQAFYDPEIEIRSPDEQVVRLRAIPASSSNRNSTETPGTAMPATSNGSTDASGGETAHSTPDSAADAAPELLAIYRNTDLPGVYEVNLQTNASERERRLYASNMPVQEGMLAIMEDEALLQELGPETKVEIRDAQSLNWIRHESPGSEVRWLLLVALAVFCLCEQALASRLSYVD